jgi:hypothetical protein
MHVLFDLTTKTTAEYFRNYTVNFGGVTHTSLSNNYSISPIRPNLIIVISVPAKDHIYIMNLSWQHDMKASPNSTVH